MSLKNIIVLIFLYFLTLRADVPKTPQRLISKTQIHHGKATGTYVINVEGHSLTDDSYAFTATFLARSPQNEVHVRWHLPSDLELINGNRNELFYDVKANKKMTSTIVVSKNRAEAIFAEVFSFHNEIKFGATASWIEKSEVKADPSIQVFRARPKLRIKDILQ